MRVKISPAEFAALRRLDDEFVAFHNTPEDQRPKPAGWITDKFSDVIETNKAKKAAQNG